MHEMEASELISEAAADYRREQVIGRRGAGGRSSAVAEADSITSGRQRRFKLEAFDGISFDSNEEWLVQGVLPRRGVAAIFGKPATHKSFIVCDIALRIAAGLDWAGRHVFQSPVIYIAAEGANGFRKRLNGFRERFKEMPPSTPFYMLSTAPNLGAEKGDIEELISVIGSEVVTPGLIVVDTLSQTLGSADENGSGMVQFVANAQRLAEHFNCLVVVVHHAGHGDDKRMRGHSSLHAAMDVVISCARNKERLSSTLAIQKLKDEKSDLRLQVKLERIIVGNDKEGAEVSTLFIKSVEEIAADASFRDAPQKLPEMSRLLINAIKSCVTDHGEAFSPDDSAAEVRGVCDEVVRREYYNRVAEKAHPDDDPVKLEERQRKSFNRAIKGLLDRGTIHAHDRGGQRYLSFPTPAQGGTLGHP